MLLRDAGIEPRLSFHLSNASASAFEAKLALQQNSNNTIHSIKIARETKLPRAIATEAAVFSSSPLSSLNLGGYDKEFDQPTHFTKSMPTKIDLRRLKRLQTIEAVR